MGLAQPIYSIRVDYGTDPVTTAAYEEIVASLPQTAELIEIFDGGGRAMSLAVGAPGQEVEKIKIPPGGNSVPLPIFFSSLSRISIKALGADAESGELVINFYKQ